MRREPRHGEGGGAMVSVFFVLRGIRLVLPRSRVLQVRNVARSLSALVLLGFLHTMIAELRHSVSCVLRSTPAPLLFAEL